MSTILLPSKSLFSISRQSYDGKAKDQRTEISLEDPQILTKQTPIISMKFLARFLSSQTNECHTLGNNNPSPKKKNHTDEIY